MNQKFASLGLAPELVRAVAEEGYTQPTPVQAQAIPVILAGRDVLAGAQTGTGKTAAFTLPMLQRLARHAHHGGRHAVRALVLTPTRELAAQVEESVRTYGRHLKLRSALVFGGVGMQPQVEALRHGVDVLVATPGRLLDHLGQRTVNLSHVEILVLDEADRMLDMGFIRDIRKVLAALPPKRQNLLFSATFSDEIRSLAEGLLHDPASVEVARRNAEAELVSQRIHPVAKDRKRALLAHLVKSGDWHQVLVFTRTKHGANRLAEQLAKDGIGADAIHGNKSQNARTRALAGFKSGATRVLVATDIAARGLDIEELPHVVNFELPNVPEDYVHRIGRTGRAGATGEAISLVSPDEEPYLAAIEKLLKRRLERTVVPGFERGSAPLPGERAEARPSEARPPRPARGEPRRQERTQETGPRAGHASKERRARHDPRRGRDAPRPARPVSRDASRRPDHAARSEDRQPASNASAQFPSSGPAFDAERRGPRRGRPAVPALLGGTRRAG
ncbi:MAG: DEAD/DEAH box helicase [Burkholderiales bacterium]|nr:DEAD/DEAH box helicase [Burkholderiales bacterium]